MPGLIQFPKLVAIFQGAILRGTCGAFQRFQRFQWWWFLARKLFVDLTTYVDISSQFISSSTQIDMSVRTGKIPTRSWFGVIQQAFSSCGCFGYQVGGFILGWTKDIWKITRSIPSWRQGMGNVRWSHDILDKLSPFERDGMGPKYATSWLNILFSPEKFHKYQTCWGLVEGYILGLAQTVQKWKNNHHLWFY